MSAEPRTGTAPPWVVDALLGTAVALAIALIIAAHQGTDRPPDPVAYLFALGFGALMPARRPAPRAVLALTVLGLFAYYALDYPPIGMAVPVVAALYSAAEAGVIGWAVGAGGVVFAVSTSYRIHDGLPPAYLLSYESVSNLALIAAAVALGAVVHSRRIRTAQQAEISRLTAHQLERDAELRVRGERERLSRDLHDTVGHTLSVISLQAGVAADAIAAGSPAAAQAVERIRAASSRSLREVGSMVRILRAGDGDGVHSLSAVPEVVETARGVGVETSVDIAVTPGELSPPVDATAFRVIQEAVTNVVRHAGATRAAVAARVVDGTLLVDVTDDGRGAGGTERGHGLLGMAERVRLLGGTLTTTNGDDGGFAVRARLPARLDP